MRWYSWVALALAFVVGTVFIMVHPLPGTQARDTLGERKSFALLGNERDGLAVWYELGEGPPVVMLPSAGREASDFNELAQAVSEAGYKAVLVQPPGIDGARASKPSPDLFDLASDLQYVLRAQGEPAVVLGHAFGNRVARTAATAYPDRVRGVVLVAAGGARPMPEQARLALNDCFDPVKTAARRRASVRYAFFADTSPIPDHWLRGWHAGTARLQGAATEATEPETWIAGGEGPMLVIAGLQDRIAPPEDTIDLLEAAYAERVTPVRLDGAGHALLPEKPAEIAEATLAFLDGLSPD